MARCSCSGSRHTHGARQKKAPQQVVSCRQVSARRNASSASSPPPTIPIAASSAPFRWRSRSICSVLGPPYSYLVSRPAVPGGGGEKQFCRLRSSFTSMLRAPATVWQATGSQRWPLIGPAESENEAGQLSRRRRRLVSSSVRMTPRLWPLVAPSRIKRPDSREKREEERKATTASKKRTVYFLAVAGSFARLVEGACFGRPKQVLLVRDECNCAAAAQTPHASGHPKCSRTNLLRPPPAKASHLEPAR